MIPIAKLTARQREVVAHVAHGLTNKEIGRLLNLTEGTVKMMLHMVYDRTGIRNRTALAAKYHREEVINGGPKQ
jgi:Response regulator containing a CheY-like receiver domain and an HTH DNA-binding domain